MGCRDSIILLSLLHASRSRHDPPIQAVTFDVGGTLIEPWPSVGHVYAEVAARHGFEDLSAAILNRQFAAAWQARQNFNHTRAEWAELVDATFEGLVETLPSETFFPDLYSCFAQPDAWRIFEDVLPTLDTLASRDLKLGIISNWDERLRPLLRQLRLFDYFDTVVISCEAGFSKPSPAIFEDAARKLALPPEAILHVGDSPEKDVQAACTAGLRTFELKRGASKSTDRQLRSLYELEALLEPKAGNSLH